MADPTMESLQKFDNPDAWDYSEENVPIFVEHELWECPHPFSPNQTIKIAVVPGQQRPKNGRMLYRVDEAMLQHCVDAINRNLADNGKPIKTFIGHTGDPKDQTNQPPLVGYGIGARLGRFGPKQQLAVLSKLLYRKGCFEQAKEYPERSPEFHPVTGEITGLALLKTDPKLAMGMLAYAESDNIVRYGSGFDGGDMDPSEKPKEEEPKVEEPKSDDPTGTPDVDALGPEERATADKFAKHYEANHPAFKYMCQKYAEAQAQPAPLPAPAATPLAPPGAPMPAVAKPEENKEEKVPMSSEIASVQYAQLNATLKALQNDVQSMKSQAHTVQLKYATSESRRILTELASEGFQFKNPQKELERMIKLDDGGRIERAMEIRENYARYEQAPVGMPIGIFDGPAEGGADEAHNLQPGEENAVVKYCERERLDPANEDDYEKAVKAVIAARHPSRNGKVPA